MVKKKITLKDVSLKCGFSVNTVSRVLRGDSCFSEETKLAIREAAAELGYIKNSAASSLSSGKSNTVAIIVNSVQNPHFNNMLFVMEKQLQNFGYDTMIFCTQNEIAMGTQKVQAAISHSVDGILYFPFCNDAEIINYMEQNHVPYVLLDRWVQGITADTARCDDELGGYLAGEHLISLGHRSFLYVGGPEINSSHWDRLAGFRRSLQNYNISWDSVRMITWEEMETALQEGMCFQLLQPLNYTAIVCFNDELAYHIMNVARGKNIRIPEDLSLIGFDHIHEFLPYLPSLTSISEYGGSVAKSAVDCLIRRIKEPDADKKVCVLPVRVFDEGTTAAPEGEPGIHRPI